MQNQTSATEDTNNISLPAAYIIPIAVSSFSTITTIGILAYYKLKLYFEEVETDITEIIDYHVIKEDNYDKGLVTSIWESFKNNFIDNNYELSEGNQVIIPNPPLFEGKLDSSVAHDAICKSKDEMRLEVLKLDLNCSDIKVESLGDHIEEV